MGLTSFLRVPLILGRWCNRALPLATTGNYFLQQRFKTDCGHLIPKCGDRFKEKPCDSKQQKVKTTPPVREPLPPQKRSIRLKHDVECCGNPCYDAYPRFDALYYRRTDKLSRTYQQTWAECPELIKKPKVICCFDKIKYPKWKKRPRNLRPKTACIPMCLVTGAKCVRLDSPKCRKVRVPPKCGHYQGLSKCKKPKAPFPSFSECVRRKPKPRHPFECHCLLTPTMCEIWSHYHRMSRVKKINLC